LKTKAFALFAVVISAIFLSSSTVVATPGQDFGATVLAKGTLAGPAEMDALGVHFSTEGSADVLVQQIDFGPGGHSGWHSHPGLIIVTVVTGAVIVRVDCWPAQLFSVGQSFIEPPLTPGIVANASSTVPARTFASLLVPAGRSPRIDVPTAPDCNAMASGSMRLEP
jgi:quercetin dioxygenase-like cupin family protein